MTEIPVCYRKLHHLQVIILDNNPLQVPPAQVCNFKKWYLFLLFLLRIISVTGKSKSIRIKSQFVFEVLSQRVFLRSDFFTLAGGLAYFLEIRIWITQISTFCLWTDNSGCLCYFKRIDYGVSTSVLLRYISTWDLLCDWLEYIFSTDRWNHNRRKNIQVEKF